MPEKVSISLAGSLDVDSTTADATLRQFEREASATANRVRRELSQPIPIQADTQGQVLKWIQRVIGDQGSFLQNRKQILASYREELLRVREVKAELARAEQGTALPASMKAADYVAYQKRLSDLRAQVEGAPQFLTLLHDTIQARLAREAVSPVGGGGLIEGMTLPQALSGGLIARGLAGAGRVVMAHPILAGTAALAGAALWGEGKASEAARYSEDLDITFANLARRTGQSRQLRRLFEPQPGRVGEAFERLGFAGEDVAKIAQAYSLPAGEETILSQARFARAYGFGDTPEVIAGIGRRVTQLGVAEPKQQGQYWDLMAAAVERGIEHGIDAAGSIRSLLALTEQSASHMGVVSRHYAAGLAGLQTVLQRGESRYFKDEVGAQHVSTLLEAFQHPSSIHAQALTMNVLRDYFGGVPPAEELGLTGYRAKAYQRLHEVEKWQFIEQRLPELMTTPGASPRARQAFGGLVERVGKGVPAEQSQLLLQALTGLEPSNQVELQQALYEAVVKSGKVTSEAALQMDWPALLKNLIALAPGEAKAILAGVKPPVELTRAETLRLKDKQTMEAFSAAVGDATVGLRTLAKDAKLASAAWLARVAGKSIADLNAARLEEIAKEVGVPAAALRATIGTQGESLLTDEELHQKATQLKRALKERPGPLTPPAEVEPPLYGPEWPPAHPYKQHWVPSVGGELQLAPLKIELSGTIVLESDRITGGAAHIPASVLAEHVIRLVQARMETALLTGPSRPAWSQGMV